MRSHPKEDLLALARTNPDREHVARRLHRFYQRCAEAGVAELERLAATVETWWPQILAFLHTGITNAGSEGTNRGHQDRRPRRLRLPKPGQPAPTHPLRDHQKARGHLDPR